MTVRCERNVDHDQVQISGARGRGGGGGDSAISGRDLAPPRLNRVFCHLIRAQGDILTLRLSESEMRPRFQARPHECARARNRALRHEQEAVFSSPKPERCLACAGIFLRHRHQCSTIIAAALHEKTKGGHSAGACTSASSGPLGRKRETNRPNPSI